MKADDILAEIRHTREELAAQAGYDLQRLFDDVQKREREAAARGVKFVTYAENQVEEPSVVVREDPPKS
jgi:hypothetical protein